MSENCPIFIRGYSRTGGTLMATILDAHPEIAMSYELYPNLLISEDETVVDLHQLLKILDKSRDVKMAAQKIQDRNLSVFIKRCPRGGLNNKDIARLLKEHIDEGLDFKDARGRLKFIEKCCVEKMRAKGKSRWGLKCSNQYEDYLSIWPGAYFLNMVRDGRDVLASQLNTGSFNKTPAKIAKGWVNTNSRFRNLIEDKNVRAYEVFYERLVNQPEEEIKRICCFLNIQFDSAMLNFYNKNLSIYVHGMGHLSMDRISQPIDSSQIGRWKKDLDKSQLEEFYSIAKETMIKFKYMGQDEIK